MRRTMADNNQDCLKKLKIMREEVNWEIEEQRHKFYRQLYQLISGWHGQLPNLRDVFRPEEIERLLTESLAYYTVSSEDGSEDTTDERYEDVVRFVARSGYRDEGRLSAEGELPLLRRATPIHHAANKRRYPNRDMAIRELFRIYDAYEANYVDESGLTHFHIACLADCYTVVRKFLERGLDPNCRGAHKSIVPPLHLTLTRNNLETSELLLRNGADPNTVDPQDESTPLHIVCSSWNVRLLELFFKIVVEDQRRTLLVDAKDKSGDTPLHSALYCGFTEAAELLLRHGADPNLADSEGLTPLHIVCGSGFDEDYKLAEILFEFGREKRHEVRVDARDNKGRTPLQLAVANFLPREVDALLNNGAKLCNFVFPSESQFGEIYEEFESTCNRYKLKMTSGALAIVERLEKSGYELTPSDARTIMRLFDKWKFFDNSSDTEERWYDNEELAKKAKEIMASPTVRLYDLLRLRPEEAAKSITSMNYFELSCSYELRTLDEGSSRACFAQLCENVARGFFRRWALDCFSELVGYRLPILCCEMTIEQLTNEDLCRICLAAL